MQMAYFDITQPHRIIKTLRSDKFDRDTWKENEAGRVDIFASLLDEYNLIGMPYHQLIDLLVQGRDVQGSPPGTFTCRYTLMSGSCGNQWNGLDIQFEHREVTRWRFPGARENASDEHAWYTENMIFDPNAPTIDFRLVRKPAKTGPDNKHHN